MPVIEQIEPRARDLGGGFTVRRLLPAARRQAVGPFVFFDHFGPVEAHPGDNHDVRPHPHIGLATVTYLFEGAMLHRDSLGCVQRIEPGAVNWMTAGRGIVHSERTPPDLAGRSRVTHGLQLWAALPRSDEEAPPAFAHTPADAIPVHAEAGLRVCVLVGEAFGRRSPVATFAPTLYLDVEAGAGATLTLPASDARGPVERAVYSVDRALRVDADDVPPFALAVLASDTAATITAPEGARFVIIGGAPLDGHRHLFWNFVSSRPERIEQAKADWTAQRMGAIDGETEGIPLPQGAAR
jgi:redox-sensitive bicupin YhaK (pirin superfamily)